MILKPTKKEARQLQLKSINILILGSKSLDSKNL